MTRPTTVDDAAPPSGLAQELNHLGFALVDSEPVHTFARLTIGSEVHLTVQPIGPAIWRVGVKWRPPAESGRMPYALVPMSLSRLGQSVDGVTIDLSTMSLLETLPRLLAESVLPVIDLGSWGSG